FPIGLCPFQPFTVIAPCDPVETDTMRSNEIELFAEVRQGLLRIDSRDDAANAEELGRPAEKRLVIRVEPQTFVAEQTTEIEKISWAAAQIQDVEGQRPIKPEVLHTLYVNAHPVVCVLVRVDLSRVRTIRVMFAQPNQLRFINRRENPLRTYRMRPSASVLPETFDRIAGEELLKFLRKPHDETMQKRCALLKEGRLGRPHCLMSTRIKPVEPSRVMDPLVQPLPG